MPKYDYVLSDQSGFRTKGSILAGDIDMAKSKLSEDGNIIISIIENKKMTTYFWQRPSLKFQDKIMFVKHMATMLQVGITVAESLEILIDQTKEKNNRKMYENILDMVKTGQTLSNSLRAYDYIFPEILVNMIATGEESGNLEQVMEYLDIQMEKEYETRKKVVAAFIYPSIILGLTLTIAFGIVIFIMPRISDIFSSFSVELPFITRFLIGFSNFMVDRPLVTLFGAFFLGAFLIFIFKVKYLKTFWHHVFIHLPVFGKILIYSNLARFARTLNSLLQSGVPMVKSLEITATMIGNSIYKNRLLTAKDKVEQGAKLGESLEGDEKLFPQIATKMLFIGEETGGLELTSKKLADLYEREVDNITKNISTLLEPILLIFMAALVGGIAMAIILPIYQLPNLLN
jgi:type IV pilus assembly protein PilC